MKYKLEFCPNPDMIQLHIQKRLCTNIESFESPDDKIDVWKGNEIAGVKEPPRYIKRLWEVQGITGITIQHYELSLTKGSAFDWNDMLEQIIAILNLELFPDSDPKIIGKPKSPSKALLKKLREGGCDV
jgi:hypothetical protein